mmetsp:Transcript_2940/g.3357  ORF Transcript_2940/g.3357 Transcript_2940/m.3357 type:complete len:88 (+) Transcript_2940:425-688(+)
MELTTRSGGKKYWIFLYLCPFFATCAKVTTIELMIEDSYPKVLMTWVREVFGGIGMSHFFGYIQHVVLLIQIYPPFLHGWMLLLACY